MQRFALPEPVTASKLTFKLLHSGTDLPTWTKLQQIAAFTPEGKNLIQHEISSVIRDDERLTQTDASWYDGTFVGVHGGNNHVYFGRLRKYDPQSHTLQVPYFWPSTYETTGYAFYNAPRLISLPGEWCLQPLQGNRTRVFFLPEQLEDGWPVNIGYPVLKTAVTVEAGTAHIEVRGFLIQRYSGGSGGVATRGSGTARASNIRIADCEVRFMSGQSGISLNYSDHVTVENCYVHHCPGWTVGIYVNRVNNYRILGNRLDKNSGSGIRHYEAKQGVLENNAVLNHYGMHSSALNFYEGCANILFQSNYVQNVIAINRSAENLTFRNNVVDSENRNAVSVALWSSGKVGGQFIKNVIFENNTFVNSNPQENWASSIFVQSGASAPEGMVVRNNILDRLRPVPPGIVEGNIFTREAVAGTGSKIADPGDLFIDPAKGDFRRKPGGPAMDAGAGIPPPPAKWTR
jgi:parallel beta-helix repeat protein